MKTKQKIEAEDILVVNDGTYLMGRSAMITPADTHIVIQSHFRKIKILRKDIISPYLLLACLGQEIVQKQIEAKSFRQGTISTLGSRLLDVKIPIPLKQEKVSKIINDVKNIMESKYRAKLMAQNYSIYKDSENLMGIKNRSKLGNL